MVFQGSEACDDADCQDGDDIKSADNPGKVAPGGVREYRALFQVAANARTVIAARGRLPGFCCFAHASQRIDLRRIWPVCQGLHFFSGAPVFGCCSCTYAKTHHENGSAGSESAVPSVHEIGHLIQWLHRPLTCLAFCDCRLTLLRCPHTPRTF